MANAMNYHSYAITADAPGTEVYACSEHAEAVRLVDWLLDLPSLRVFLSRQRDNVVAYAYCNKFVVNVDCSDDGLELVLAKVREFVRAEMELRRGA